MCLTFLVIARNSAFTYKGKPIDIKRVGEELGVRYAVEGSVRKVDGTLRVNVQLVSTETGAHLWAERFDVRRDGVGYGVDDIVRQIAMDPERAASSTPKPRAICASARAIRMSPTSCCVPARSTIDRPHRNGRPSWCRSTSVRWNSTRPRPRRWRIWLKRCWTAHRFSDDPSTPEKLRRAEELLKRAELLRPDDMKVMWTRVYLLGMQNRCPEVIAGRAASGGCPSRSHRPSSMAGHLPDRAWAGLLTRSPDRTGDPHQSTRIRNIGSRYRVMGYRVAVSRTLRRGDCLVPKVACGQSRRQRVGTAATPTPRSPPRRRLRATSRRRA